ncbi:MAG: hypothetical protein WBB70_11820, partial [Desulfobacterales bacterium]
MKPIRLVGIVALLILGVIVTNTLSSQNTIDVSRYFYKGDGRLNLVNAKNGLSFNGKYRESKGIYNEKALKA